MAADRRPRQAFPLPLAPVSRGGSAHVCMLTRHGPQGSGARPRARRSPARSRPSGRVGWAVSLALGLVLTVVGAHAATTFTRLSAREIRAKIIGKAVTDDTHWSQHFRPDGTLHSIVLSQLKQGTWKINGNALCLTLKTRKQETTTECYEVWMWKDHVEYRDKGVTVMQGFVRKAWR
jgi:hypothetical protein